MRILRLSANKESFRTINFNPVGISLIVAEQKEASAPRTGTYNGVGKTLSFALINYCLASNRVSAFKSHLRGWTFSLAIETEGKEHLITRSADKPSEVSLDGESCTLSDLKRFLQEATFSVRPSLRFLTFRSLVPRFLRFGRGAYEEFWYATRDEVKQPYGAMLRSAFLLGLDLDLAQKKYELRTRQQQLDKTMTMLEADPLFAELLEKDTVDIELLALREQADGLRRDLQAFEVAEDFHEIEQEANSIKRTLDRHRREAVKIEEALLQIERSIRTRDDLSPDRVYQIYEEAQTALPEAVRRRVEEVLDFHAELQTRRIARLSSERQNLRRELKEQEQIIEKLSSSLNQKLRYLSEHRALDEYVAVNNQLAESQQRIAKLEESKALREKVDREKKRIDLDLAEENIRTDEYLADAEPLIREATSTFRGFARELYGNRPSGLSVSNDSGVNQQRYRIDAHITADAAEGINEAKIFCFDMSILSLRRRHRFDFLAHDSTLFGPVDPRQRLSMFMIADRICREQGLQYIAALNLHDITSVREQVQVDDDVLDSLFDGEAVVLHLTDESPRSKLLGIEVDMNYTKDVG